jgi:hypothetical protein
MVTVGNGSIMNAVKMGKLRIFFIQCNGRKFVITLEKVMFVPDL